MFDQTHAYVLGYFKCHYTVNYCFVLFNEKTQNQ